MINIHICIHIYMYIYIYIYTPETMLKRRTEAMFTVARDEHDCEGEESREG